MVDKFKKIILILIISATPLFAATIPYSLGFGIGLGGESISGTGNTSLSSSIYYAPLSNTILNPSLRIEADLTYSKSYFSYDASRAIIGIELFRTLKNPINKYIINNRLWAPAVEIGVETNRKDQICGYFALSLFKTLDKDYVYEILNPFITFTDKIESWGIVLFKYTPLYF